MDEIGANTRQLKSRGTTDDLDMGGTEEDMLEGSVFWKHRLDISVENGMKLKTTETMKQEGK